MVLVTTVDGSRDDFGVVFQPCWVFFIQGFGAVQIDGNHILLTRFWGDNFVNQESGQYDLLTKVLGQYKSMETTYC